jgi:hypothetical protein
MKNARRRLEQREPIRAGAFLRGTDRRACRHWNLLAVNEQ